MLNVYTTIATKKLEDTEMTGKKIKIKVAK